MNDDTKQLIKYAAIVAAGYFVYEWLQNSGLWAQWFGGTAPATAGASNSFTSSQALLAYCQANPAGSAIYVDPTTGVTSTATCAQWIASNSSSPISTPAALPSASATGYQQAIAAMKTAAGNDAQTIDQWGYYWQNTPAFSGAPNGFGVSGSISPQVSQTIQGFNGNNPSSQVSAEQFVGWLQQAPMTFTSNDPVAPTYGGEQSGLQGYDFGDWVN